VAKITSVIWQGGGGRRPGLQPSWVIECKEKKGLDLLFSFEKGKKKNLQKKENIGAGVKKVRFVKWKLKERKIRDQDHNVGVTGLGKKHLCLVGEDANSAHI